MYGMVWYGMVWKELYVLHTWAMDLCGMVHIRIYALWVLEMSNTTTDMGDIYADM